ncbi:hypothetical protein LTR85_008562 [Meristemomyces frigidus]|nr:hypothetical protein LTR85_008562 [Meristemomyces frigidus]
MAAPVAAPPTTYAFIPPPPLPEFYLPKNAGSKHDSASSTSAEDASWALVRSMTKVRVSKQSRLQTNDDNACDNALPLQQPAAPGDATDETMIKFTRARATSAPFASLPPPPPGFGEYDVPPLAVYHICRICIRPRSAKYHREHPIPINGVPPPPGICRRCRVTQVDEEVVTETKVSKPKKKKELVEVVTRGESNEIKLGLACIVPDEDYVPMQEMKDRRGRRLLRELDCQQRSRHVSEETGEEREITYRHVRVRETERTVSPAPAREGFRIPPLPPPQARKPKTTVSSTAQDAIDAASVPSQEIFMTTAAAAATAPEVQPVQMPSSRSVRSVRVTEIVKEDTAKASSSASSSSRSTLSGAKVSARATSVVFKPERTESQIRKIAREEVEKYRQAERKLEAHPDAYAHGCMIPVQRRIERQVDIAEPLPWRKKSDHIEVRVEREKEAVRASVPPSRPSQPSQRAPTAEEEWRVSDAQAERSEKYTGSGLSEARSHRNEEREIVVERVVRRESQPAGSQKSSGSRQSRARPAAKDLEDDRNTTSGSRSVTSDKTRWACATNEPKRTYYPASNRPASVKMQEVVGWDDARASYTTREIWLPTGSQYDVVEVIEEVELPPEPANAAPRLRGGGPKSVTSTDSRISERVQELQEDAERQERAQKVDSPPRRPPASTRSSKPSERDYRNDNNAAGTTSRHSSRYQEVDAEVDVDVRYRREEVRSEIVRRPSALSERTIRSQQSRNTQASRQTQEPAEDAPKEPERVRAYDRRMATLEAHKAEAISLREERSTGRRRDDANASTSRPSDPLPSGRSARSARSPGREREYIQVERRVQPADEPFETRSSGGRTGKYYIDTEELWRFSSSKPNADPRPQSQLNKAQQHNAPEERKGQEQRRDSPSETSTRVRFAKKVEMSPTPPGSDASSAQFRNFGARGVKGRPKESAAESGEDLIAEYERRGRARARGRAAPAAEERQKVYDSKPGQEQRPRLDGVDDTAYRPRMSRPLARALSESPSRERLSEAFSDHRSKVSSKVVVGGFGPYRPEQPRTGSTEIWGGSDHASRTEERVEHSFGGWAEDVPGGSARL